MDQWIKVTSWSCGGLLVGSLVCLVAFYGIGSDVDASGYLREPFFLLPLFWLFLASGLVFGAIMLTLRRVRTRRRTQMTGNQ